MSQNQNFKLNTSNYIGFEYKKYLNEMKSKALTQPTEYAKLRNNAIEQLSDLMSKQWYDLTYEILTEGGAKVGTIDIDLKLPKDDEGKVIRPSYPAQELAKLALSHTETIVDMMDEIVDLLVPEKFLGTALSQIEAKTLTDGIKTD